MDQALKAKWTTALRSGEYKQGVGKLHDAELDAYCCLGVFCKIAGFEIDPASDNDVLVDGQPVGWMPIQELIGYSTVTPLWMMNDGYCQEKQSFNEIADYIEQNL